MEREEIKLRAQKISLREDGIIYCINLKVERHTLEDAKESIEAIASLCDGVKHPVLVDMTATHAIDAQARRYYSGEEAAKIQSAVALIVGSSLTKIIANFFIGLNKTQFPTNMFTSEEEAIEWLKNCKNE